MRPLLALTIFLASMGTQAQPQSVTALTDATFSDAISNCLAEAPVTGLCTSYGASSGFGTMPNWDTSQVTDMSWAFYVAGGRNTFNADITALPLMDESRGVSAFCDF